MQLSPGLPEPSPGSDQAALHPFIRLSDESGDPRCACGGSAIWDGHKYRCHGCGLYLETCCDGGRCR